MTHHELEQTARELVADDKGILAQTRPLLRSPSASPRSRLNRRKTAVALTVNCSLLRRISPRSSAA